MEDTLQSGLQQDQWFSCRTTSEKLLEKRSNSLGSGALHFIRTRSSIRRELKRHCNQSKSSESTSSNNEVGNGGGGVGGLGKWLREHLGGGSRGSHDVSIPLPAKRIGSADKSLTRVTYASQNLYCSLPREHGRHCHNIRKHIQPGLHSRPRSNSANFHEKSHSDSPRTPFIGTITRGGPIYGSEGKTIKRRNRDRRRHSLNETQDSSQNHRKSAMDTDSEDFTIIDVKVSPIAGVLDDVIEPFSKMSFDFGNLVMEGMNEEENECMRKFSKSKMPPITEEEDDEYKRDDKNEDESEEMEAVGTELEKIEKSDKEVKQYEEQEDEEDESDEDQEQENKQEYVAARLSETEIIDTEPFFIFDDISPEVFRDRRAMIDKFKELVLEQIDLRQRNRLLEYWVVKNSGKATRRITTLEEDRKQEVLDHHYKKALQDYKHQLDEILNKKNELAKEMSNYNDKYKEYLDKDYEVFLGLMNLVRSTGSGLIFAKTGRQLTESAVQNLIYRQLKRREHLCTIRFKYIINQHQYEEIKLQIDQIDTLDPGKSSMDYEELCLQQVAFKEKIDERDQELEKLRYRIQQFANILAHYKEKASCLDLDIKNMKIDLNKFDVKSNITRDSVNVIHSLLAKVRNQYSEKRHKAGFLVAQPVLLEMERTLKVLEELRDDIEAIKNNVDHPQTTVRNKTRNEKSSTTTVPKYKPSSKPGRS